LIDAESAARDRPGRPELYSGSQALRRQVEPNGDKDMTDTTRDKSTGLLKNKPLLFLIAGFVLLIAVGIATS
jgi:hypothetical protein